MHWSFVLFHFRIKLLKFFRYLRFCVNFTILYFDVMNSILNIILNLIRINKLRGPVKKLILYNYEIPPSPFDH